MGAAGDPEPGGQKVVVEERLGCHARLHRPQPPLLQGNSLSSRRPPHRQVDCGQGEKRPCVAQVCGLQAFMWHLWVLNRKA